MSSLAAILIALLGPVWVGAGIARFPLRFGEAYFVGFLGGGAIGLILYAAGLPPWAALAVVAGIAMRGARRIGFALGALGSWPWWAIPLACVAFFYCAADLVTGWDAAVIWLSRVRALQAGLALPEIAALNLTNPSYPFLGPFWWWIASIVPGTPVELGRVIFFFVYLGFFIDLEAGPKRLSIALAYLFFRFEWIGGYQDGLIMALAAWWATILAREEADLSRALWFLPFGAALGLIKTEGAALAVLLAGTWLLTHARMLAGAGLTKKAVAAGFIFALFVLAWPTLLRLRGIDPLVLQGSAFQNISWEWLRTHADRLPVIATRLAQSASWPTYLVIPAAIFGVARTGLSRVSAWLLLALAGHAAFLLVVFWGTHAPFQWHLDTALGRLVVQAQLLWVVLLLVGRRSRPKAAIYRAGTGGDAIVAT